MVHHDKVAWLYHARSQVLSNEDNVSGVMKLCVIHYQSIF